jgi:hypothetical protein
VLFLVALFLIKNISFFEKSLNAVLNKTENGLAYNNITVGEFVYKDTDGDKVSDWEESLYGLDPTKKETTEGVPDSTAMDKLKMDQSGTLEANGLNSQSEENLTETDKFSRELFSTVTTLSQGGEIDQATIDKISSSLAEHIQNSVPRKIYTLADIKIINDSSPKAIKNYFNTSNTIQKKYPDKGSVIDILQRFMIDANNVDTSILVELDPIIEQMQNGANEVLKMNVPQSLSSAHLDLLNAGERIIENLTDMKLFDIDPILALSAISQYEQNIALSESAFSKLMVAIKLKLNN